MLLRSLYHSSRREAPGRSVKASCVEKLLLRCIRTIAENVSSVTEISSSTSLRYETPLKVQRQFTSCTRSWEMLAICSLKTLRRWE